MFLICDLIQYAIVDRSICRKLLLSREITQEKCMYILSVMLGGYNAYMHVHSMGTNTMGEARHNNTVPQCHF